MSYPGQTPPNTSTKHQHKHQHQTPAPNTSKNLTEVQCTFILYFQVNDLSSVLSRKTACECLWEIEISYPVRSSK
jgi:hypothetical protein